MAVKLGSTVEPLAGLMVERLVETMVVMMVAKKVVLLDEKMAAKRVLKS